ncbi:MAG TPA: 1,4-beta-xylanase [Ruminiclostridium sp.]|jgi:hypothetical protein|nr:glycoside hydrolase family 43 protein [Clostridiaceae bacterium]HAA24696.1 1,4-beta-xylanase [Ruminiclostridium sp.]
MQAYLFVHFREKTTPDGEQVHFGLSRDGFNWEAVNGGAPVLWAYYGDKGARDFTITRCKNDGKFYIFATDLSLAYGMRNQYKHSWREISVNGSKCFSVWESEDLVKWTEQRLVKIGCDEFGCMWAPDIIYDRESDDYVIHWSSSHRSDNYNRKAIYYSRTKDFKDFSEPRLLYMKEDSSVIDSAIYEENGKYYMFLKSDNNPAGVIMLKADHVTGPYTRIDAFDESMSGLQGRVYEGPTAVRVEDGKWCLFLDYFGAPGAAQGYVPFISDNLEEGRFSRADELFHFPYGFKHGTVLTITMQEYERIKTHNWEDKGWV